MSKITKSAKGESCTIRLPGICRHDNETVVACHLNGGGMGAKVSDIHIAYADYYCHSAVDGRIKTQYTKDELQLAHLRGVIRTQDLLLKKGLLKII